MLNEWANTVGARCRLYNPHKLFNLHRFFNWCRWKLNVAQFLLYDVIARQMLKIKPLYKLNSFYLTVKS